MTGSVLSVLSAEALRAIIAEELDRRLAPVVAALTIHDRPAAIPDAGAMLSRIEVARLLGVNARTLRRLVLAGELPAPVRIGKRTVRWRRGDVEEWLGRAAG